MIQQLNSKNIGITSPMPGFQHCDGMHFDEGRHNSYRPLAIRLIETFHPRSVLELGSGAGSLAWHMNDLSKDSCIVTLDGNPDTILSPYVNQNRHFICRTDQAVNLVNETDPLKFDLFVSFEHFEHIQDSNFYVLVENVLHHAAEGAVLVATAATWKYDNDVHCNVKSRKEWITYFRGLGFKELDISIVPGYEPFNFQIANTSELILAVPGPTIK